MHGRSLGRRGKLISRFEKWIEDRTRRVFELKPTEKCKTETCAFGKTIPGKECSPEKCKFYYTNAGSEPIQFSGLFSAAMMLRETRLNELREEMAHYERTLPFWAIESYKAAERGIRQVEAEFAARDPAQTGANSMKITPTGSKAFGAIEKYMAAKKEASEFPGLDELDSEFENNPTLSKNISSFFEGQS